MKLAFVVQRYGAAINGGAELHCRWIAEHMSRHADVEVLTTRADDYITWKNHYRRGREVINGVPVRRFGVTRRRDPERFGRVQDHVFANEHGIADELRWLDEEGPRRPGPHPIHPEARGRLRLISSSSATGITTRIGASGPFRRRASSSRRPSATRSSACASSGTCSACPGPSSTTPSRSAR